MREELGTLISIAMILRYWRTAFRAAARFFERHARPDLRFFHLLVCCGLEGRVPV